MDLFQEFSPEKLGFYSGKDITQFKNNQSPLFIDSVIFELPQCKQNIYFKNYLIKYEFVNKIPFPGNHKVPIYSQGNIIELRQKYNIESIKALAKMNLVLLYRKFELTFLPNGKLSDILSSNNIPIDVPFIIFRDELKNLKINPATLKQIDLLANYKAKWN